MAVILDRDCEKWFRPALGQLGIGYRLGADASDYKPDFVAETATMIYLVETKRANQMADAEVLAKRDAAVVWCERVSAHNRGVGGKSWDYLLVPHDAVAENRTLASLAAQYTQRAGTN